MCTGIKIDYDRGSVIGRTMDFEVPVTYNALYFPRGYNFCDDLMGKPLHSKYKALGVCFANKDPLKDGVNEYGLAGITNTFTGFNLYDDKVKEGKINISSLDYFNYCLTHYKSVEELIEDIPNIHFSSRDHRGNKVITPDFHFMFSDSTKRCIVVEPKKGEIVYYENPYNVMTNSPRFDSHVKRLHKYYDMEKLEDFNSSKDLPGGYDPFSRFIKSFYLVKRNKGSENSKEAFSHFYNIMNSMVMPEGFVQNKKYQETTFTRYTCGYDTHKKLLTVKSHTNPTVYEIGFDDIKDETKRQEFIINEEFTSEKLI
nr:linear amide C-N hydrolase [Tissierella sp.]